MRDWSRALQLGIAGTEACATVTCARLARLSRAQRQTAEAKLRRKLYLA